MLGASGLCDVIIATTMVMFVSDHILKYVALFKLPPAGHSKNCIYYGTNEDVLNKLITLTVETGLITALATNFEIILLVVYRHTNMHFIMYVIFSNDRRFCEITAFRCLMLGKMYAQPTTSAIAFD